MAEQFHDHARMLATGEQQGRRGVPPVVQPHMPHTGGVKQPAPVLVVDLLVDWPAVGLREDDVLVLPLGAGQHPLAGLTLLVLDQSAAQVRRQREGASAAAGLRFLVHEAFALDPMDRPAHRQRAAEQVDVLPLQRQRLRLAQAERKGDGPARLVAQAARSVQDSGGLFDGQRGGNFAALLRGRIDERGDVAVDALALHRNLQGARDDAVHPQDRRGGQALFEEQVVKLLEVLGL